jgi:hypothetical protein
MDGATKCAALFPLREMRLPQRERFKLFYVPWNGTPTNILMTGNQNLCAERVGIIRAAGLEKFT